MKKHISLVFALILTTVFLIHKKTPFYTIRNNPSGDTIEYKASAYVIQPNDKLENLLVKLPGISTDKDGRIFAQGDTVKMILVDGEEFYSDSPGVVAHVIRAEDVNKIQSYYRYSDQAVFTGIDDKVKIKVLNVILKKGRK